MDGSDLPASALPQSFERAVLEARTEGRPGDLRLLAEDVAGWAWQREALALVLQSQSELGDTEGARTTWQALRQLLPQDGSLPGETVEVGQGLSASPGAPGAPGAEPVARVLLFTGHRIDDGARRAARFPAAKTALAKEAIHRAVLRERRETAGRLVGIAGGANGGDILFHEVCEEIGIPSELFLALPPQQYVPTSVEGDDPGWVARFEGLCRRLPTRVLCSHPGAPAWLEGQPDYSLWRRTNRWMWHNAKCIGGGNVTLIALWDRQEDGAPGGTQDMLAQAEGARQIVIDTGQVFRD